MAAPHSTFNQLLSTTLYKYRESGELMNQVINGLRLMKVLKDRGRVVTLDGGHSIVVNLEYARNATASWMAEYGELDLTQQDILTAAQFNPKMLAGTAIVTDWEIAQNKGRSQQINLAKKKISNLVESIQEQFNNAMCASDGTTDPNKINGLPIIVDSAGTLGGISRSAQSWWSANETAVGGALSAANMSTMYNSCSRNIWYPDLIVTTRTQYERYEALVQAEQQIIKMREGDIGFDHLTFKGTPVIWDHQIDSGVMYFLTTKHLEVGCFEDHMFTVHEAQRHPFQLMWIHACTWFGNFYPYACNTHGKLTGLT